MKKCYSIFAVLFFSIAALYAGKFEGFYCDVFNDMGTNLSGPNSVPAIAYIGCSEEGIKIPSNKTLQSSIMDNNANDSNGVLLYPDGEPRFAVIYSHGGMMSHSSDLGVTGRKRVTDHYYHGGSHVGSCAGSYMLSTMSSTYYRLWAGSIDMSEFNTSGTTVSAQLPDDSPLLKYGYDFGGDKKVAGITHNNGGSVLMNMPDKPIPPGTEILALHADVTKNPKMNGHCNAWGWKQNDTTGRAIGTCPHPEGSSSGEKRDYMAALLLHAIAGIAPPDIKAELSSGRSRVMDKGSADNQPALTKIGDRQYHHFIMDLEAGAKNVSIAVKADAGYDMHIFVAKDSFAFSKKAIYADSASGADKVLAIPSLAAGKWYVGVRCATTVTSTKKTSGSDTYYEYSGKMSVLNGVAYTIEAKWDPTDIYAIQKMPLNDKLIVRISNKNVYLKTISPSPSHLSIYNAAGKLCWDTKTTVGLQKNLWQPSSSGMYFVRFTCGDKSVTKRFSFAL